jgi:hypothetical protein
MDRLIDQRQQLGDRRRIAAGSGSTETKWRPLAIYEKAEAVRAELCLKSKIMNFPRTLFVIILLALTSCLRANMSNDRHPSVKAARGEYFWVVETGSREGLPYSIVRFYNGHQQLVGTQLVDGVQLNASRASVQRKLNRALKKMIIFEEVAQK